MVETGFNTAHRRQCVWWKQASTLLTEGCVYGGNRLKHCSQKAVHVMETGFNTAHRQQYVVETDSNTAHRQ